MLLKQSLSLDYGKNGKRGQRQYQKISIGLPEHTIGVSCLTSHEERCILLLSGIEVGTPRATVRRYRLLPCAKQRSRKVRQRAGTFWLLSFLIGDCKQAVRFDSICILAREHVMFPRFSFVEDMETNVIICYPSGLPSSWHVLLRADRTD